MRNSILRCLPLAACILPCAGFAATISVGPGETYTTISAAVAAAQAGDTIQVQAGLYENDFPETKVPLTLMAVGGRVVMRATVPPPNQKGILLTDTDATVIGFDFTGAHIPNSWGGNGAGIRYQGGNLTVQDCYFAHNQDGLLSAPSSGTITILNSEFAYNGNKTGPNAGYTHNIYVGMVAKLDIENSYIHSANVGHEVKSRAAVTVINNSRIVDGPAGTASYSVDLPQGGIATITNSYIEKGPHAGNQTVVSFGEEGNLQPNSALSLSATLVESDLTAFPPLVVNNTTTAPATLGALSLYGFTPSEVAEGPYTVTSAFTWLTSEPPISAKLPW